MGGGWDFSMAPVMASGSKFTRSRGLRRAIFQPGQILTVEPGIYWPGVGGCRIEDVGLIIPGGVRKLSRFPQQIEI